MKIEDREITLCGDVWKIKFTDELEGEDCDGDTEPMTRTIHIRKSNKFKIKNFEECQKHYLRHEIIHAMLFSCGLAFNWKHDVWGHDETFIDWFALNYAKIKKVYEELECE